MQTDSGVYVRDWEQARIDALVAGALDDPANQSRTHARALPIGAHRHRSQRQGGEGRGHLRQQDVAD